MSKWQIDDWACQTSVKTFARCCKTSIWSVCITQHSEHQYLFQIKIEPVSRDEMLVLTRHASHPLWVNHQPRVDNDCQHSQVTETRPLNICSLRLQTQAAGVALVRAIQVCCCCALFMWGMWNKAQQQQILAYSVRTIGHICSIGDTGCHWRQWMPVSKDVCSKQWQPQATSSA